MVQLHIIKGRKGGRGVERAFVSFVNKAAALQYAISMPHAPNLLIDLWVDGAYKERVR